jgi:hypothetical protein
VTRAKDEVIKQRLNPSSLDSHERPNPPSARDHYKVKILNAIDLEGDHYFVSSSTSPSSTTGVSPTPAMREVILSHTLNAAQTRAFAIIASCVSSACATPLRMYLGDMGGTGKSRVIKALLSFFDNRHEPHRLRVMVPAGSAAAQIDGSTYHSLFGFSKGTSRVSKKQIARLKDKHALTDLYLLDEISMVSLTDFASLSERMSLVFDNHDAFGSKHIVVCGDFTQLPPPGAYAAPLYSNKISLFLTKLG